ncbi:site-specific integrase [Saccharopolyspora gloriosae]|uniref:tyrosine-type recombinase/integrase n=1 Tax=Saccharopolyspora gloriosae TaxID=455344 RepID=UPI001FB5C073|nr:site-specific integrase [Saccharopolyspora gloriosae]
MAWIEQHGAGWRVRYQRPDGTIGTDSGYTNPTDARSRADDINYESKRGTFTDPRKAQTTLNELIEIWREAHEVSSNTWSKYDSYIRNHIEPRFGTTEIGSIKRITVKTWSKKLRRDLKDATVAEIISLFSTILAEAAEEDLITKNPCRRLGLKLAPSDRREIVTPTRLLPIADRCGPYRTMIIVAAYTGLRWGELAGLQWRNVHLDRSPHAAIVVDPNVGALHETAGHLELGPPKTPASARTVHLPPFLAELLREHATTQFHDHVFTGARDGLLRRSNFNRRIWRPAVAGQASRGWRPLQPGLDFHGLRHTQKSWLSEDRIYEVLQHDRLGHEMSGVRGIYTHVTQLMIDTMITALENKWRISQMTPVAATPADDRQRDHISPQSGKP